LKSGRYGFSRKNLNWPTMDPEFYKNVFYKKQAILKHFKQIFATFESKFSFLSGRSI